MLFGKWVAFIPMAVRTCIIQTIEMMGNLWLDIEYGQQTKTWAFYLFILFRLYMYFPQNIMLVTNEGIFYVANCKFRIGE